MLELSMGEELLKAKRENYAIGAFNIFNYSSAKAAIIAAEELKSPLILQTSMGTVKTFGAIQIFRMLEILRKDARIPVYIHLDHCTDKDLAIECIDIGWDSIMIDASAEPLNDNIDLTLEIKKYAKKYNVCVEGELGIIKGEEEEIVFNEEEETKFNEAIEYINATGIDALAPSIGTAHGLYKGTVNINYELVKKLSKSTNCPVVIHGGTGLSDEVFRKLVKSGATKINISTALKHAYIDSCSEYLSLNSEEYNPLNLDTLIEKRIYEVIKKHITIFGSTDKIK